jgi:hypothetical protein
MGFGAGVTEVMAVLVDTLVSARVGDQGVELGAGCSVARSAGLDSVCLAEQAVINAMSSSKWGSGALFCTLIAISPHWAAFPR